jgi:hypothetical protein
MVDTTAAPVAPVSGSVDLSSLSLDRGCFHYHCPSEGDDGGSTHGAVTPSRRSTRHGIGLNGATASDEDSLAKAMRRKTAANLDFAGINKSSKSFLTNPIVREGDCS